MALPAGRYGVTKNQLLKIKKLPMNTIKLIEELTEKFDLLGSAAFKNSTSVVTQSTDLVESGAVKDIVGFGNKNRVSLAEYTFIKNSTRTVTPRIEMPLLKVGDKIKVQLKLKDVSGVATGEENTIFFARVGQFTDYALAQYFDTSDSDTQTIELTCRQNVPSESEQVLYMGIANSATGNPSMTAYEIMVSKDGGAYEPYHASVEESLEQKCDNSVIGTVEDGTNPTKAYAVGEHMIRSGKFCTVTVAVTTSSTWTEGSNYTSGDVADELLSKVGTFTLETGFSVFASINSVKQNNGICVLNIAISFSSLTTSSWVKVGVITNVSLPLQEMRYINITLNGKVVITRIKTDGEIDIFTYTAISENDTVTINIVYTTN